MNRITFPDYSGLLVRGLFREFFLSYSKTNFSPVVEDGSRTGDDGEKRFRRNKTEFQLRKKKLKKKTAGYNNISIIFSFSLVFFFFSKWKMSTTVNSVFQRQEKSLEVSRSNSN
jgi:hypothetical protein